MASRVHHEGSWYPYCAATRLGHTHDPVALVQWYHGLVGSVWKLLRCSTVCWALNPEEANSEAFTASGGCGITAAAGVTPAAAA